MNFKFKDNYQISDLIEIMNILRAPDGCPWDREQTHKSIRSNFIEETYEVVEAIDTSNTDLLKEELGDVLLQVVFHSKMEEEIGNFNFDDVTDGICKKLIHRHPHIFSDTNVTTTEEVLENWDKIKMSSKSQKTQSDVMKSISVALPTLMRSAKVQKKAAKVGFDFENKNQAMGKITEEFNELKEAICMESQDNCFEEIGDLLFSVVNVARMLNIDADHALAKSCDKFIDRFSKVEALANKEGIDMSNASIEELDSIWNKIKRR